jgi:hypothetical protein
MVKAGDLPILAIVALAAIGTIPALMTVIFGVTPDACARWLFDQAIGTVTSSTSGYGMFTEQWEFSILVMIKFGCRPTGWRMAVGAIRAASALVGIIPGMAGDTGFGRFTDRVTSPMTSGTTRYVMFAKQRETGVSIVVERCRFPASG